jgi:hypothetical protein
MRSQRKRAGIVLSFQKRSSIPDRFRVLACPGSQRHNPRRNRFWVTPEFWVAPPPGLRATGVGSETCRCLLTLSIENLPDRKAGPKTLVKHLRKALGRLRNRGTLSLGLGQPEVQECYTLARGPEKFRKFPKFR